MPLKSLPHSSLRNSKIDDPADLRGMSPAELQVVADELRADLIDAVSKTGGHLGASLGVVELTVALHATFNTPDDKLIWEVNVKRTRLLRDVEENDSLARLTVAVVETKQTFSFPVRGQTGWVIDEVKPAKLQSKLGPKKIDATLKTFAALKSAKEKSIIFEGVNITIGQGNKIGTLMLGEISVDGDFLEAILTKLQEKFSPDAPVTMSFKKANFNSGHDLKDFSQKIGVDLLDGEVEQ